MPKWSSGRRTFCKEFGTCTREALFTLTSKLTTFSSSKRRKQQAKKTESIRLPKYVTLACAISSQTRRDNLRTWRNLLGRRTIKRLKWLMKSGFHQLLMCGPTESYSMKWPSDTSRRSSSTLACHSSWMASPTSRRTGSRKTPSSLI